ncbi:MAG: hypothetical protein WA118_08110 [Carboxydocellales bacterium]
MENELPYVLKVSHIKQLMQCGLRQAYELVERQERAKQPAFPVRRLGKAIRVPRDPFLAWLTGNNINVEGVEQT